MTTATTSTSATSGVRVLGAFCWHELHTRDRARAKEFYTALIGWTTIEKDGYTEWITKSGVHVGGMTDMPPGVPPQVPAHWAVYVNVDDVDATARKAAASGGKQLSTPMDIPNVGRICAIADPTGAWLNLFKGVGACGERHPDAGAGQFCWTELLTNDPAASKRFHVDLFGWQASPMPMPSGEYTMFLFPGADPQSKDAYAGGMLKIDPQWGPMPSCWLSYIQVDDVDATAARIGPLGGTLYCKPCDIPDIGRFAVAADPTGAMFAIFTYAAR